MPSEFEQEMLCIQDPIDRIRAATGRVKSVKRDDRTLNRILRKYDASQCVDGSDLMGKFDAAKTDAAEVVIDAIQQCRGSGINQSVAIVEAIIDARAGEERHYRDGDEPVCRKRRRY